MPEVKCPDCGSPMELRDSRYGKFYGCIRYPQCEAAHGAHPDGTPLGTPANKETKQWRIKAHDAFDLLWMSGAMKRKNAYRWMQQTLGMTPDEAHIGKFGIDECKRLIHTAEEFLKQVAASQ